MKKCNTDTDDPTACFLLPELLHLEREAPCPFTASEILGPKRQFCEHFEFGNYITQTISFHSSQIRRLFSMLNLEWNVSLEPAWCWGGWSRFLKISSMLLQPLQGGALWRLSGHGLHADVHPGVESGPQMRAEDMRNLNGRSKQQQQHYKGTNQTQAFVLTILK